MTPSIDWLLGYLESKKTLNENEVCILKRKLEEIKASEKSQVDPNQIFGPRYVPFERLPAIPESPWARPDTTDRPWTQQPITWCTSGSTGT